MSLSLAYDTQLSRVRVTGTTPGYKDTFTRTSSSAWGSADSGQAWTVSGGAGTDYNVASGVGTQANTTANVIRGSILPVNLADVDFDVTVSTDKLAVGADQAGELVARYADANNHYVLRLAFSTTQQVTLQVRKTVASTQTALATLITSLTHAANTQFKARFQVIGSTLKGKVWLAASTEPDVWTVETADTALTAAGSIGLRSVVFTGASNTPVTFKWDNLNARGSALVERSANQVTWTQVRGGDLADTPVAAYTVDDYEFAADALNYYRISYLSVVDASSSITPSLNGAAWIKSVARPFLNTPVEGYDTINVSRRPRQGVFDVVGRSLPVAVTDIRGSREFDLHVVARSQQDRDRLDLVFASGEPIFLHVPPTWPIPSLHAVIGTVSDDRPVPGIHLFTLPLIEVAAPGADVVGATGTFQTLVNNYATFSAVLSAFATFQDILEQIAQPGDIVVP